MGINSFLERTAQRRITIPVLADSVTKKKNTSLTCAVQKSISKLTTPSLEMNEMDQKTTSGSTPVSQGQESEATESTQVH